MRGKSAEEIFGTRDGGGRLLRPAQQLLEHAYANFLASSETKTNGCIAFIYGQAKTHGRSARNIVDTSSSNRRRRRQLAKVEHRLVFRAFKTGTRGKAGTVLIVSMSLCAALGEFENVCVRFVRCKTHSTLQRWCLISCSRALWFIRLIAVCHFEVCVCMCGCLCL